MERRQGSSDETTQGRQLTKSPNGRTGPKAWTPKSWTPQRLRLHASTSEGMGSKPGQGAKTLYARGTAKKRNKKLDAQAPSPPPRPGKYPTPPLPDRELYSPRKWTAKTPDLKTLGIARNKVFLPGKSHGQRHLVCCSPWGRKESDTTEQLTLLQGIRERCGPKNWMYILQAGDQQLRLSSVQFSHSVVSDSETPWTAAHQASLSITKSRSLLKLMSMELTMPSNYLILCRPLLLLPSAFPSIRVFPINQLFTSGDQSIGVSGSTSVLPMNTQDWSPLGWTGWISLQFKGISRVFSNTTLQKHQFFGTQLSL